MPRFSLPEKLVNCQSDFCKKVNQAYQQADYGNKILLTKLSRELRKNIELPASDIAERLKMARSTLFYKLKKMGLTYYDIVQSLKDEAEEALQRKLETRKRKRLPPRDYQEFLERDIVKRVINTMKTAGRKQRFINSTIRFWYRMCKELGLAPEDFVEMEREQLWDMITQFIADLADEGLDINSVISTIQTIQKWLGVKILPPGVTQQEYKGKYQEAEIPREARNKIVLDLIDLYEKTGDDIYLKTIQAMIFLYYTGSRRQALGNFTWGEKVRIKLKDFVDKFGTDTFRVVSTLEKRGIRWTKLIPLNYAELLPNTPFSPSEINKISKILKKEMNEYRDLYNHHTILYLNKGKTFHIWRHTATREYLRAFKYNRSLVAKLLGWIKESNLKIYGDFQLFELLNIMAEEHKVKFVDEPVYKRIKQVFLKAGVA